MASKVVYRNDLRSAPQLRVKVGQYRNLFDGELPKIQVFGNFIDRQGNIAFLSSGCEVNADRLMAERGPGIVMKVDGEMVRLQPTTNYEGKFPFFELSRHK